MQQTYRQMKETKWRGYSGYDAWFNEPITNAHFILVATYEELVPAFQALHARSGSLKKFYAEVKAMAKQDKVRRREYLASLISLPSPSQVEVAAPNAAVPTAAAQ